MMQTVQWLQARRRCSSCKQDDADAANSAMVASKMMQAVQWLQEDAGAADARKRMQMQRTQQTVQWLQAR